MNQPRVRPRSLRRLTTALLVGVLALLVAAVTVPGATFAGEPAGADEPVYGTNVALATNGGVASSSGVEVQGRLGPELAIDGISGSDDSRWSGEYQDDSWWQVELAEPVGVDHVSIRWSNSCPVRYKLQVSEDGQSWTDATDVRRPEVCAVWDVVDLSDHPGTVRFVRMQGLERRVTQGFPYGYSINELEVWTGPEAPEPPVLPLIPQPASLTQTDGATFTLEPDARIHAPRQARPAANALVRVLRPSTGYRLPVVKDAPRPGDISIVVDPATPVAGFEGVPGAYTLRSGPEGVAISAPTKLGAFYAVQTLRQLFPSFVESDIEMDLTWTTPAVQVADGPRFEYRGLMLDLARNFLSVRQIRETIDSLAHFKMNVLRLHLSDDQGWRIEITNEGRAEGDTIDYTALTRVSGQTAIEAGGPQGIPATSGFLTQEQYRSIVEYAAEQHITVIPEIDGPSHSNAMLHAIPELNTAGAVPQPAPGEDTVPADRSQRVGHTSLDTDSETTYTFLEHVFSQLAAMTPGPYLHLGGDEGHSTDHDDYVRFMNRSTEIIRGLGKKPMGWNEYAVSDLEPGDVVQYYNHDVGATVRAANERGARVVVSWHPNTYLDYTYAQGDFDTYYNWDVTGRFPGVPESSFLGLEAPLWTENVRSDDEAEYQIFPRAISTAELGWSPASRHDGDGFVRRMGQIGGRLTLQGVNFFHSPRAAWQVEASGVHAGAKAGKAATQRVGAVLAPGTDVSDFDVRVRWGDGSPEDTARLTTTQLPDVVHGNGAYLVEGSHTFARPGRYDGTLVVDGPDDVREVPFTSTVGAHPGKGR
jgi:N-acetyl-beta-hexosaminidase